MAESRSIQGRARANGAASAAPAAKAETPQATVLSPPTIPASDTRKAKRKAKVKAWRKAWRKDNRKKDRQREKKVTGETAVTPAPASVRQKSGSIFVDVSHCTGMDVSWNLAPDGTVAGITCSFRGSKS
ncbi:hypothetical protein FN846DRAFT_894473 [Sphaerosporella brunnea]|nr:hypothetical protein FN846DRAFT_894473 [Sphaerosporella brunnea]